jgi:hypothetical protein
LRGRRACLSAGNEPAHEERKNDGTGVDVRLRPHRGHSAPRRVGAPPDKVPPPIVGGRLLPNIAVSRGGTGPTWRKSKQIYAQTAWSLGKVLAKSWQDERLPARTDGSGAPQGGSPLARRASQRGRMALVLGAAGRLAAGAERLLARTDGSGAPGGG